MSGLPQEIRQAWRWKLRLVCHSILHDVDKRLQMPDDLQHDPAAPRTHRFQQVRDFEMPVMAAGK